VVDSPRAHPWSVVRATGSPADSNGRQECASASLDFTSSLVHHKACEGIASAYTLWRD
jgi:hypothetical protein